MPAVQSAAQEALMVLALFLVILGGYFFGWVGALIGLAVFYLMLVASRPMS